MTSRFWRICPGQEARTCASKTYEEKGQDNSSPARNLLQVEFLLGLYDVYLSGLLRFPLFNVHNVVADLSKQSEAETEHLLRTLVESGKNDHTLLRTPTRNLVIIDSINIRYSSFADGGGQAPAHEEFRIIIPSAGCRRLTYNPSARRTTQCHWIQKGDLPLFLPLPDKPSNILSICIPRALGRVKG